MAAGIVGADDADDVIHDAFCRLWSRHASIGSETEAIKLSYTAVRNSAIDALRSARSHPTVEIDESVNMIENDDEAGSKAEKAATYDAVVRLSREALTERQFEIFRLHDIEGAGYDEIASALGITNENVRTILSRSRKIIRELYRKQNPQI